MPEDWPSSHVSGSNVHKQIACLRSTAERHAFVRRPQEACSWPAMRLRHVVCKTEHLHWPSKAYLWTCSMQVCFGKLLCYLLSLSVYCLWCDTDKIVLMFSGSSLVEIEKVMVLLFVVHQEQALCSVFLSRKWWKGCPHAWNPGITLPGLAAGMRSCNMCCDVCLVQEKYASANQP